MFSTRIRDGRMTTLQQSFLSATTTVIASSSARWPRHEENPVRWHAATTNNTTTRGAPRTARGDRARHLTAGRYDHVWTGGRTTTTGTAIHRQHEPSMTMIRFVDEHAPAQPQRAPRNMRAATNTKLITREDHTVLSQKLSAARASTAPTTKFVIGGGCDPDGGA